MEKGKLKTCDICHVKLRGCIKLPEGVFCNSCFNRVNKKRNEDREREQFLEELSERSLLRPTEVYKKVIYQYPDLDSWENQTKSTLKEKVKPLIKRASEV